MVAGERHENQDHGKHHDVFVSPSLSEVREENKLHKDLKRLSYHSSLGGAYNNFSDVSLSIRESRPRVFKDGLEKKWFKRDLSLDGDFIGISLVDASRVQESSELRLCWGLFKKDRLKFLLLYYDYRDEYLLIRFIIEESRSLRLPHRTPRLYPYKKTQRARVPLSYYGNSYLFKKTLSVILNQNPKLIKATIDMLRDHWDGLNGLNEGDRKTALNSILSYLFSDLPNSYWNIYSHHITDPVLREEVLRHSIKDTHNLEICVNRTKNKINKKFDEDCVFRGISYLTNRELRNLPLNPADPLKVIPYGPS